MPWMPSRVISIGAAATSDSMSPISKLPLQAHLCNGGSYRAVMLMDATSQVSLCPHNGAKRSILLMAIDCDLCNCNNLAGGVGQSTASQEVEAPAQVASSRDHGQLLLFRPTLRHMLRDDDPPDCYNNAMIGKVGCYIVAWSSHAVIPFSHQQMTCKEDVSSISAFRALHSEKMWC